MAPSRWNNQPSDMALHNQLLGAVTVVCGFTALAVAVAFVDAMKVCSPFHSIHGSSFAAYCIHPPRFPRITRDAGSSLGCSGGTVLDMATAITARAGFG